MIEAAEMHHVKKLALTSMVETDHADSTLQLSAKKNVSTI